MKDILLVGFFSKNESPYIDFYRKWLSEQDVTYDVLYFERYGHKSEGASNEIVFSEYCPTGGSKVKKLGTMKRYAMFLRKLIRTGKYKGLIVFATVPAFMIADILLKKYKGRYILDIRDYTHELKKPYFKVESKLIRNAYATVISSRGFKEFLPKGIDYVVSHNVPQELSVISGTKPVNQENITIGFVGSIRYYEENCRLIEQFGNNNKYSLEYYGTTTAGCDLQGFCEREAIENVKFHGRFNNAEKPLIYEKIDIINSIYGTDKYETITALPNRLYDACLYQKPIIVSKGTYLAEIVKKYDIGIPVDVFTDDTAALLNSYLDRFDENLFRENCSRLIEKVNDDIKSQKAAVLGFCEKVMTK